MPDYEGLIIRPPSEADSLILQYTIGCSHNRCIFCPAYKQKRFRIRSLEEMRDAVEACVPAYGDARRIFLADGDPLHAPSDELMALLSVLNSSFPGLRRIGMYANAISILGKTKDELIRFREKGLGILYLGVESGDDRLLTWMNKGVTATEMEEAGKRVKAAGIKLSVTILLGIGGGDRDMSVSHSRMTGRILTAMGPDYVGALTTMVVPGTPLHDLERSGAFTLPPALELLRELADILEHTHMERGLFLANHASNYLPIRVKMPDEREDVVRMIRDVVRAQDTSLLRPDHARRL